MSEITKGPVGGITSMIQRDPKSKEVNWRKTTNY